MNWTNEQQKAIETKNSNILVAAAAGSGKTAVLVERIIQKIINDKVDIDKLLVVTFTNAAASEMREKILDALYKKIDENPEDLNLQKQIILLKKANICTIHSFCLEVIRNNFFEIDFTSNFRIGNEEEIQILKQDCMEELFEEYYENENKSFEELLEIYTGYKDDVKLKELILKIYNFIQSMPFPFDWLEENIKKFNLDNNIDFSGTEWGKILIKEFELNLEYCINILKETKEKLSLSEELRKYYDFICLEIDKLKQVKYEKDKSWNHLLEVVNNIKFDRWPTDKKIVNNLKDETKLQRDIAKKRFEEIRDKIFIFNSEDAIKDLNEMYPILKNIKQVITEFDFKFKHAKKEKNLIDFNDIEHFALKILVKHEDNKFVRTDVAQRYMEKFNEIAIDEYQDSNRVQEFILSTISNGKNMFMVGDVKQSIYKFRQACPELFLEKYNNFGNIISNDLGITIKLFKNFRSRRNILNIVNEIFQTIMTDEIGDNVNYTKDEFLNLGANYLENNEKSEMYVINLNDEFDEEINEENDLEILEKEEVEAKFVANKIEEFISSKKQVTDKKTGKLRNVEYRDIVILLRSTANLAPIYEKELLNKNIPVYSESSSKYLDTLEIQVIINYLKIIDNPLNDIALITVLRSPLYNFNDNEIIRLRLENKTESVYESLKKFKEENSSTELGKKVENFLKKLEDLRFKSKYKSVSELIWGIYEDTDFLSYVLLMPNGNLRHANLKILFERAKEFEKTSYSGLYNFLKFIQNIRDYTKDLSSAKIIGENENVVRIMSIHKSKGLEFPYVFLSSTNKKINLMDLNEMILLHQNMGFGPEYLNYKRKIEYTTAAKTAMRIKIKEESIAEEMRILYVALTRAKEKLIITATVNNYNKDIANKQIDLNIFKDSDKINSILMKKYISYYDWISLVLLKNEKLKNEIEFKLYNKNNISLKKTEIIKNKFKDIKLDYDDIVEKFKWKYEYLPDTLMPIKTSVSDLKNDGANNIIDFENVIPEFYQDNNMKSSRKGTIIHKILQNIEFDCEYNEEKIENLIKQMNIEKKISDEEIKYINKSYILNFINSETYKEIVKSKKVFKEMPFCIKLNAKQFDILKEKEWILVQGIIDLYYIDENENIIMIDYKTDIASKEELIKRYKKQLEIYSMALEKYYKKKVYKKCIYSLYLNEEIPL